MTAERDRLADGTEVAIWVGIRMMFGYPARGVIRQYIPDYPGGPTYEVAFSEGDIPFACIKADWLFPHPREASDDRRA